MVEPVMLRPRRPCPICKKPSAQKFHPFCSARWLGVNYAIPAAEADTPDDRDDQA